MIYKFVVELSCPPTMNEVDAREHIEKAIHCEGGQYEAGDPRCDVDLKSVKRYQRQVIRRTLR